MALRGHASIQGSTDVPTLYHSIHGYMAAPTALKKHDTLQDYLAAETMPTGYWANMPKFMVSYLKSMYGDAATPENDFGYDWHPKILGDHSHMADVRGDERRQGEGDALRRAEPGHVAQRQARAGGDSEARMAGGEGQLAHRDGHLLVERAGGQERRGEDRPTSRPRCSSSRRRRSPRSKAPSPTPSACCSGTYKAAEAPGDCRSDTWFTYQLGKRLKKLYANTTLPRDEGFKNLVWDYEHENEAERKKGEPRR